MDATLRKPFQGITNIIRFNWHFYVLSLAIVTGLLMAIHFLPKPFEQLVSFALIIAVASIMLSLATSFFIYDCSGLYSLDWLNELEINSGSKLLNINAGFDETSLLISGKFPGTQLMVFDFYDPSKHTEVSIKRARRASPSYAGTRTVSTTDLGLQNNSIDHIFTILSAHEIRNRQERINFFKQLRAGLKPGGKMIVVEHLRDIPNFIAYNVGFLHFFSRKEWLNTFKSAGLHINKEQKVTYFLSVFTLENDGITP